MALHNRDYMGGAAPSPWDREPERFRLRAYHALIVLTIAVWACWSIDPLGPWMARHFVVTGEGLAAGRVWPLLLAPFFHADGVHMALGLLFLWWLGRDVEAKYGARTVVALFVLGGVATGLVGAAVHRSGEEGGASGTGFYVAERLVLTNRHVVDDQDDVELAMGPDARPARGTVIARGERGSLDLALVQVDLPGKPIPFSDQVIEGRTAFAIGYGVVGGLNHRQLVTGGRVSGRDGETIIFDATVNPGNSGGPLVDASGRWVGVVFASSGGGERVTAMGYAVDGRAAAAWLARHGCQVRPVPGDPRGDEPPQEVRQSVGRITVRRTSVVPSAFRRDYYARDQRVFGSSGPVWALALFLLCRFPRRTVWMFGAEVPLLVLFLFFAMGDLSGALRTFSTDVTFGPHLYHLAGGAVGYLGHRLGLEHGLAAALKAPRQWLRRRRAAAFRVLPPLDDEPEPAPASPRLDPATRKRMDELLEKISRTGMASLTPEEKAFLEQASGKLRGDG